MDKLLLSNYGDVKLRKNKDMGNQIECCCARDKEKINDFFNNKSASKELLDDDRSILCYDHSKNGCYDKGGMNQKKNDSHSIGKWEDDIPNQHGILFMS